VVIRGQTEKFANYFAGHLEGELVDKIDRFFAVQLIQLSVDDFFDERGATILRSLVWFGGSRLRGQRVIERMYQHATLLPRQWCQIQSYGRRRCGKESFAA
jgi:hypothetical protein